MAPITTYHATLHAPESFREGFRPLSHFGSPRIGLWQVVSNFIWITSDFPTGVYIYEVELELGDVLDLPDYDSPSPISLLRAYEKHINLSFKRRNIWKDALPYPVASRHNEAAVAFLLRLEGWSTVKYQNVHEAQGIQTFSHINVGPEQQDVTSWSNLSVDQVHIKGYPAIVPLSDIKNAINDILGRSPSWRSHPFAKHLEGI